MVYRTPSFPQHILAMCRTRQWRGYHLQDTTVHLLTLLALVWHPLTSGLNNGLSCIVPVRIWDTVGEEQTLKTEYKVISGRMYAFSTCDWPSVKRLRRNDLEWDGESKRIIAVGDGREKFVFIVHYIGCSQQSIFD